LLFPAALLFVFECKTAQTAEQILQKFCDNGCIDDRSQILVHANERTQVHSAQFVPGREKLVVPIQVSERATEPAFVHK